MPAGGLHVGNSASLDRDLGSLIRCLDLTSLEPSDTPERIEGLCRRAVRPDAGDPSTAHVAAVCVHFLKVPVAKRALEGSDVKVGCVAGGFPSGEAPLGSRLGEIRRATQSGADEIDVVLRPRLVLDYRDEEAFAELSAIREAAEDARLKVIVETGTLHSEEAIQRACALSMEAGADFLKTSTGKAPIGATPEAARVLMRAVAAFERSTGREVGIKVAGGVRTTRAALGYARLLDETLGSLWRRPQLFRIGASSLLDALVEELRAGRAAMPIRPR
jgi:deoxyribose-phosphate aldolase